MKKSIGLINGRHEMPVEGYLLEEATPGDEAYTAAYEAAYAYLTGAIQDAPVGTITQEEQSWGTAGGGLVQYKTKSIDLQFFYTGLTEAVLGALDGFDQAKRAMPKTVVIDGETVSLSANIHLMRYDTVLGEYQELRREAPAVDVRLWDDYIESLGEQDIRRRCPECQHVLTLDDIYRLEAKGIVRCPYCYGRLR